MPTCTASSRLVSLEMYACNANIMTWEHLLQHCHLHDALRWDMWPEPKPLRDKLYGSLNLWKRTAAFVTATVHLHLAYEEEEDMSTLWSVSQYMFYVSQVWNRLSKVSLSNCVSCVSTLLTTMAATPLIFKVCVCTELTAVSLTSSSPGRNSHWQTDWWNRWVGGVCV